MTIDLEPKGNRAGALAFQLVEHLGVLKDGRELRKQHHDVVTARHRLDERRGKETHIGMKGIPQRLGITVLQRSAVRVGGNAAHRVSSNSEWATWRFGRSNSTSRVPQS